MKRSALAIVLLSCILVSAKDSISAKDAKNHPLHKELRSRQWFIKVDEGRVALASSGIVGACDHLPIKFSQS